MSKCHVIFNEMGYSTKVAKIEYNEKSSADNAIEELNGKLIIYYYNYLI